jgi:hypothetical protein
VLRCWVVTFWNTYMSLPYLKKIDNSDSEPSAYSFIHPSAILYDRPALRLANRLRWDRLNIVPELQTGLTQLAQGEEDFFRHLALDE